jgi:uncharacterized protein YkwD
MTTGLKALTRRIGALMVMLVALSPAIIVTAPQAQAASAPSARTVAAYEARVLWRINKVRVSYHRGRVGAASCPDRYAETWAAYLARTGRFYHREMMPFLRACHAQRVAENLARGNISADQMVVAWMKSPGHRANILDGRLTKIGVGATYAHGQWTVATNFTRP